MTIILGIESSCDETAAAIVTDQQTILGEKVMSQAADFAEWGGVVPELAARSHVQHVPAVIADVLAQAGISHRDIDAIAVSSWPGLMGSLLCGVTCAKMLSHRWDRPLIAVDHIQAHLQAASLEGNELSYPAIGLVVSGGHSHLYHLHSPTDLELIGGTIDDAAGEAFDKAAAILDLGYPGGPIIDQLAQKGDPRALTLPRSLLHSGDLRLSFAGLKTALLYQVRGSQGKEPLSLDRQGKCDAAASFQAAVCDVLVKKSLTACSERGLKQLIIGGGVACNSGLRSQLSDACREADISLRMPLPKHCADNASMVASIGHNLFKSGTYAPPELSPLPTGAAGPGKLPRSV